MRGNPKIVVADDLPLPLQIKAEFAIELANRFTESNYGTASEKLIQYLQTRFGWTPFSAPNLSSP